MRKFLLSKKEMLTDLTLIALYTVTLFLQHQQ